MGNHAGRPGNGELLTAAQGKNEEEEDIFFFREWSDSVEKMRERELTWTWAVDWFYVTGVVSNWFLLC